MKQHLREMCLEIKALEPSLTESDFASVKLSGFSCFFVFLVSSLDVETVSQGLKQFYLRNKVNGLSQGLMK